MDWSDPVSCVVPSLDGPVLEALARSPKPMTGLQVHRVAKRGSAAGVAKVLDRLVSSGLVTRENVGSSGLYQANRQHLAWPAVEILADLRATLLDRLRAEVDALHPAPTKAILFGSAARGDGTETSDIDLLLVHAESTSPWDGALHEIGQRVHQWTGNHVDWTIVSTRRWTEMEHAADALVDSVRRDGISLLGGASEDSAAGLMRLTAQRVERGNGRGAR